MFVIESFGNFLPVMHLKYRKMEENFIFQKTDMMDTDIEVTYDCHSLVRLYCYVDIMQKLKTNIVKVRKSSLKLSHPIPPESSLLPTD